MGICGILPPPPHLLNEVKLPNIGLGPPPSGKHKIIAPPPPIIAPHPTPLEQIHTSTTISISADLYDDSIRCVLLTRKKC